MSTQDKLVLAYNAKNRLSYSCGSNIPTLVISRNEVHSQKNESLQGELSQNTGNTTENAFGLCGSCRPSWNLFSKTLLGPSEIFFYYLEKI